MVYEFRYLWCFWVSRNEGSCCFLGLEVLNDDFDFVKAVELLICGKIFVVEILDKLDVSLVVLYDTLGEDDININVICFKVICDRFL